MKLCVLRNLLLVCNIGKQGKGSTFCTLLVGGPAPKPLLPDLAICGCGASLRQTKYRTSGSSEMKEASMPANGENQFRHGGVVIVLYDLLCGDIDLFAECPG